MRSFAGRRQLYRSFTQYGFLLRRLVASDLRARYIESLLGALWMVIQPLLQVGIYFFVFSIVLSIRLGAEYEDNRFAWMVAGMLPWLFFSTVVTRGPMAALQNAGLITKTRFPAEIGSLVQLISALLDHLIEVAVFVLFLLLTGYGISLEIMWIVPYLVATAILALGISWALAALNVFLRDIGQLVGVLMRLLIFVTPVFYPIDLVPENVRWLYRYNPIVPTIEGYRAGLLGRTAVDPVGLWYLIVCSVISLAVGGWVFKRLQPAFADFL